jgi:hypothetical protein
MTETTEFWRNFFLEKSSYKYDPIPPDQESTWVWSLWHEENGCAKRAQNGGKCFPCVDEGICKSDKE